MQATRAVSEFRQSQSSVLEKVSLSVCRLHTFIRTSFSDRNRTVKIPWDLPSPSEVIPCFSFNSSSSLGGLKRDRESSPADASFLRWKRGSATCAGGTVKPVSEPRRGRIAQTMRIRIANRNELRDFKAIRLAEF
ncbi:PREDICTED: uncharacterized protein LOC105453816 [Wasmannia auropunctata]|uniref:uncharacterized protein LOC105453816 n=1 Tax=Wasmannia auropunctata TaxID=64793 RepID=UPI0005EE44B9|nr:PREDICTED: uncharacterized protein LOC105453816 [Wasmannia auropunctata]